MHTYCLQGLDIELSAFTFANVILFLIHNSYCSSGGGAYTVIDRRVSVSNGDHETSSNDGD